jgi:hypothetical protein
MSNKYQWEWKSNCSCCCAFKIPEEWRKYSDVETSIIEDAYQQKCDQVELDNYIIDLKHFLQINKLDPVIHEPIRRISCENISKEERLFFPRQDALRIRRKSFGDGDKCE